MASIFSFGSCDIPGTVNLRRYGTCRIIMNKIFSIATSNSIMHFNQWNLHQICVAPLTAHEELCEDDP